jgi:Ppx/GppA phosphatase family
MRIIGNKLNRIAFLLVAPAMLHGQSGAFGGIELASSSIKGLTFTFQPGADIVAPGTERSVRVKRLQYAERNRNFISMRDGCKLNAPGLDLLVSQTKEVIKELRDGATEHKLGKLDLFAVGSSGLGAVCNTDEIIARVQSATGLCMEFISASDEARFSMGFVLPRDRYRSVMLDVGSGNTKGGYYVTTRGTKQPPREWHGFEITYGARTLKDAAVALSNQILKDQVASNPTPTGSDLKPEEKEAAEKARREAAYYAAVEALLKEKVLPQIEQLKNEHSGLGNAAQIYMVGGSIWATSTWAKPVQQMEWAINSLRLNDYQDLIAAIQDNSYLKVREGAFSAKVSQSTKTGAEAELADVLQRFDKQSLYAGVSLAKFITKQLAPSAMIYFPTTAAWISGYAREKFDETRTGVPSCVASANPHQ